MHTQTTNNQITRCLWMQIPIRISRDEKRSLTIVVLYQVVIYLSESATCHTLIGWIRGKFDVAWNSIPLLQAKVPKLIRYREASLCLGHQRAWTWELRNVLLPAGHSCTWFTQLCQQVESSNFFCTNFSLACKNWGHVLEQANHQNPISAVSTKCQNWTITTPFISPFLS